MNSIPAQSEKEAQLARRMQALGILETDLDESFVRSGGHGGQNVNKVATCVMLVHRPSGMAVKCQETRQQGMNRWLARKLLLDKIESQRLARAAAQRDAREKLRRQKRKRSRAAKEQMLAQKSIRSKKKAGRRWRGED
jgi:protein subunit release factor B